MRILSRHHDYYDWVAGYGVDPKIVYPRTPVSVGLTHASVPWRMDAEHMTTVPLATGTYLRFRVSFGVYPSLYRRVMGIFQRSAEQVQVRVFETVAEAREGARELGVVQPRPRRRWMRYRYEYVDARPRQERLPDARWRRIGAPIFARAPIGWVDNRLTVAQGETQVWYTTDPILADLRFTEVPAQDVFQRVQSFLRLDPPDPAEFSDAQKLRARGFDGRSFKHRPGDNRK